MNGRQWSNPDKLYDVFTSLSTDGTDAQIETVVPTHFEDKDILNRLPNFTYPCKYDSVGVELYTFVLTDVESKFLYGFCRFSHDQNYIMCLLSRLPWFEVFYSLLNKISEISNGEEGDRQVLELLEAVYYCKVPATCEKCTVLKGTPMEFSFDGPDIDKFASIPHSRNLTEYYSAVDYDLMITVFTSLLNERRLLVTSKKLSKLTACCHAAAALLYPCYWQHLFIPVLPEAVIDFVSAPMPYIIGVQECMMQKVRHMELDDAVILDLDTCTITSSHSDRSLLPSDWISSLKKSLQQPACEDSVSMAFLRCMARVIGAYRDGFRYQESAIEFDEDLYVSATTSHSEKVWRETISRMQYFSQFIDDKIAAMVTGETKNDLFDMEIARYYEDKNGAKYKEWIANVKKQGKKIKTKGQHTITDLSKKVQEKTKKAYKDMKTKLDDKKKKDYSIIDKGNSQYGGKRVPPNRTIIGETIRPSRLSVMARVSSAFIGLADSLSPATATPEFLPKPLRPGARDQGTDNSKSPINALSPKRQSYNNALKRYKNLSLSEEDLPSPGNFDLLNDPDLSSYLHKSYSSTDVAHHSTVTTSTPETTSLNSSSANMSPVPPPRRKRAEQQQQHLIDIGTEGDANVAHEVQGFADNFVPPPSMVESLSPQAAQNKNTLEGLPSPARDTAAEPARSSINDLMGLDLSSPSAADAGVLYTTNPANSMWNKTQPNYYVSNHVSNHNTNPFHSSYSQPIRAAFTVTNSNSSPSLVTMNGIEPATSRVPTRPPPPMIPPRPLEPRPLKPQPATQPPDPLAELKW